MDGEQQTINNAAESSTPAQSGGLISTTEFVSTSNSEAGADPEGANNTEGADNSDPKKDGQEAAGEKEAVDDDKLDRFDKHPRFQELRAKAEAAEKRAAKLEQQVAKIAEAQASKADAGDDAKGDLPYKDPSKMSSEELLDWQSEDPHGFYQNVLAQAKHEISQEFDSRLEKKTSEDAVVSEYQSFAEQHPDFDSMWEDGTLPDYMDKHPGHNAISAYLLLTRENQVKSEVEKAVAEAEKKFASNQRAKREQRPLAAGPQTTGTMDAPVDAELKDSKKFGGSTRVLANRLRALRQKQSRA